MRKRTEMEWYEEVRVEEKFQYGEASIEEIDTAIKLKLGYMSWQTKEKEE
jgi:hypothetical protein